MRKQFRDFESARKFVQKLGLKSGKYWREYVKSSNKPDDIPSAPWSKYEKEWEGMGDWLGTKRMADQHKKYRSFNDAVKYVCSLNLKSQKEWQKYCKSGNKPDDIPSIPNRTYKNKGWITWGDWLGTDKKRKEWLSFTEARKFVHGLKLQTFDKYLKFCRTNEKPENLPNDPVRVYKKEWNGASDWLGTQKFSKRKGLRNFEEARKFVHGLNLKSMKEYTKYCQSGNKPIDIPNKPEYSYKKEWNGNGDWLGTGSIASMKKQEYYLPWPEAKKEYQRLAREYGIKNTIQWRQFKKDQKGLLEKLKLPAEPQRVYTKERIWKKEYGK
jgi:hypothetical protein